MTIAYAPPADDDGNEQEEERARKERARLEHDGFALGARHKLVSYWASGIVNGLVVMRLVDEHGLVTSTDTSDDYVPMPIPSGNTEGSRQSTDGEQVLRAHLGQECTVREVIHLGAEPPYFVRVQFDDGSMAVAIDDNFEPVADSLLDRPSL